VLTTWLANTTTTVNYITTKSDSNKLIDIVSTVVPHSATDLRLRVNGNINKDNRNTLIHQPTSSVPDRLSAPDA
jgi:hypothetical protein